MKKYWGVLLSAMLLLLCSPALADEPVKKYLDFTIVCGQGETTMPEYPNFAGMIGEGLTDDDFIITYPTGHDFTFHEDGRVSISANAYIHSENAYKPVWVTYSPKDEKVGAATSFQIRVSVRNPLSYITPSVERIVSTLDYSGTSVTLKVPSGVRADWLTDISYDSSVVSVRAESAGWQNMKLIITFEGTGETEIVVTAYNGRQITVPVKLYPAATKVSFAKKHFTAMLGETVDLGLDMGNGTLVPMPYIKVMVDGFTYSASASFNSGEFFPVDASHFYAGRIGYHEITMTTEGRLSGSVTVDVYSETSCTKMSTDAAPIYEGDSVVIKQYGADGKETYVPLSITRGAELAVLKGDTLIAKGAGEVEVTAHNLDGSVYSQVFVIEVMPTEIYLNATDVTLEIGETFDAEVSFDKGSLPYSISIYRQDQTELGLYATRIEGDRIIAQAPGTAVYQVWAGSLSQRITITVPDGDRAVCIDCPDEPLSMGQSYQLYVRDKTGEIYPASFTMASVHDTAAEITAGGYLTALREGTAGVTATLKDGRTLTLKGIRIIKRPKWIRIDAVVVRRSGTYTVWASSDVGTITDLTFEVKNPNIIAIENNVIKPKALGKTVVTAVSVTNPEATTTFTVEVLKDNYNIFIGSTSISVPYGSMRYMPVVTDENYKELPMNWEITHENPGAGNPEKSGFVLEDGAITCTWPTATCEVTGTVRGDNKKVVVSVSGYTLPVNVAIEPLQIWLEPGERQKVTITTQDECGGYGVVYWFAETEGVVSFEEYVEGKSNTLTAVAEGATLVAALLENGAMAMCVVTVYAPEARLPGDVNEDGLVDVYDALRIMQYSAGWNVALNGWQGDVNADGKTNLQDAIRLLQYGAGLDVELKNCLPE